MKKLSSGLIAIIIGMALIFSGFSRLFIAHPTRRLSDEQIIERARQLGMVKIKELIEESEDVR